MKTYLPGEFINSNYKYNINEDYIIVKTNNNCYTNYNTSYCDCYYVYPHLDYLSTEAYSCNYSNSGNISYHSFTSDWVYRSDITDIFIVASIIFMFIFLFVYKPVSRLFGRWLKC